MITLKPLQTADLQWHGDTPEARHFGDIYFSRGNGLEESRHVFLDGNRLCERWQQLHENHSFVIGETGFGTGLNFLLAWQLWQRTAPASAELFFISTELFPLKRGDLARALSFWPELEAFSAQLLEQYPALAPGFHWLRFPASRVTLLLLLGDANDTMPQLADCQHPEFTGKNPWAVDAWFLDGFAPAKNPQLWQQDLLAQIASLSKSGTTLATFTAAGQVRRDLSALGFSVQKIAGYGSKRDMLVADYLAPAKPAMQKGETPWLLNCIPLLKPGHVAVIGAGLAGCHIARALAERGVKVGLYEEHAKPAQEASGNPQGALYTKLSVNGAALSRFSLASLLFACRHYNQPHCREAFHRCGLLQLQDNDDASMQDFFANNPELVQWLDASKATGKSGITLSRGGWWLPQSGWINPQLLCAQLLDHPLITTHFNTAIANLQAVRADATVIACANRAAHFPETDWLSLRPVRGQITTLPANTSSSKLQCVLCDEGYLTPAVNGQHCIGASFVPDDTDTALRDDEQQHNLALLSAISQDLHDEWQHAPLNGRAALRCTTPDHLPMVGPLPDREAMLRDYAVLRHNAKAIIPTTGSYLEGLWVLAGFGGRGLCYIPLAAELLASQMLDQPRPLPRSVQMALSPARFVVRELVHTHAGR